MSAPVRPLPGSVARWTRIVAWLRATDALCAWLALYVAVGYLVPEASGGAQAVVATIIVAGALAIPGLGTRWRPITALVALSKSASLRPGDRAWFVRSGRIDPVLVTARHGLRFVIALPAHDAEEAISVRRTRVVLLPAELDSPR